MHYMNVQQIYPLVCSHNTDHVPAEKDERVLSEIKKTAEFLNPSREEILFSAASVTMKSTPSEKIDLFRSLFRGREDVYALRWHNQKTGKSGYSPVCRNKWIPGICHLPQVKCADCNYRSYEQLDGGCFSSQTSLSGTSYSSICGTLPFRKRCSFVDIF